MTVVGSRSPRTLVDQDTQVEYLEDELFGHLPGKLLSAEVAVRGCLLVDRPLQVQFPRGGHGRSESPQVRKYTRGKQVRFLKNGHM